MVYLTGSLLTDPTPDFSQLLRVLNGEEPERRVPLVELYIDQEVLQAVAEHYLGLRWVGWDREGGAPARLPYFRQLVTVYAHLGYDYVPLPSVWRHRPSRSWKRLSDTALLSRGEREWASEGQGLIASWQEFEQFPWEQIRSDPLPVELLARSLMPGMKIAAMSTMFEYVLETLLGFEGLFYMLHDDPDLVAQVFARWGQKVYEYYTAVIQVEEVGVLFHADDLGFKTSTFVRPAVLRELVFPWLQRYAALAHEHDKPFWYHCCGNIYVHGVIEELIDQVRIDAFHSFQDAILPVTEFKAKYGHRVATLGGVDMDKLTRLDEADLRAYVREILEKCMPGGRFALASGNTIANYVPLHNYLAMLDESRRWQL
jgi:uroporphyrinogen decarboxylase